VRVLKDCAVTIVASNGHRSKFLHDQESLPCGGYIKVGRHHYEVKEISLRRTASVHLLGSNEVPDLLSEKPFVCNEKKERSRDDSGKRKKPTGGIYNLSITTCA